MANVKKVSTTDQDETVTSPTPESDLQKQVADLTALVQTLLQQNQQLKTEQEDLKTEVTKKTPSIYETVEEKLDIDPREYVRIVSLTTGGLNLQGVTSVIRLNDFGSTKLVTFEDVRAIVDNHPKFAHEGGFLIQSEKAVKALYLDDAYQKFISKESIDNILTLPVEEIVDTLKSVSPTLRANIVERIVIGIASNDGKYQDRYKINAVSEFIGKDLNELARELEGK